MSSRLCGVFCSRSSLARLLDSIARYLWFCLQGSWLYSHDLWLYSHDSCLYSHDSWLYSHDFSCTMPNSTRTMHHLFCTIYDSIASLARLLRYVF